MRTKSNPSHRASSSSKCKVPHIFPFLGPIFWNLFNMLIQQPKRLRALCGSRFETLLIMNHLVNSQPVLNPRETPCSSIVKYGCVRRWRSGCPWVRMSTPSSASDGSHSRRPALNQVERCAQSYSLVQFGTVPTHAYTPTSGFVVFYSY